MTTASWKATLPFDPDRRQHPPTATPSATPSGPTVTITFQTSEGDLPTVLTTHRVDFDDDGGQVDVMINWDVRGKPKLFGAIEHPINRRFQDVSQGPPAPLTASHRQAIVDEITRHETKRDSPFTKDISQRPPSP